MAVANLHDLYLLGLRQALGVEQILLVSLPKLETAASDERLKEAFRNHAAETAEHRDEVAALIEQHGGGAEEAANEAMDALVRDGDRLAAEIEAGPLRDAALIAAAQRIEHYEIALYGTLAAYAETLGHDEEAQILVGILEEEEDTDDLLSDVAEGVVNPSAAEAEAEEEE